MGKALALALLLFQLQPVIAAGICLHAVARDHEECDMPAPGGSPAPQESERGVPPECSQMAICAPTGPVIPQVGLLLVDAAPPEHPDYSSPALLVPGDPIAPPEPPPIA